LDGEFPAGSALIPTVSFGVQQKVRMDGIHATRILPSTPCVVCSGVDLIFDSSPLRVFEGSHPLRTGRQIRLTSLCYRQTDPRA
jgi:hypothetical protein